MRTATDAEQARRIITDALPPIVASTMTEDDFDRIRRKLEQMSEPRASPRMRRNGFLAAVGVFLLVFLATFPFIFIRDAVTALRVSNTVAW